jgi:hypothetical protein
MGFHGHVFVSAKTLVWWLLAGSSPVNDGVTVEAAVRSLPGVQLPEGVCCQGGGGW